MITAGQSLSYHVQPAVLRVLFRVLSNHQQQLFSVVQTISAMYDDEFTLLGSTYLAMYSESSCSTHVANVKTCTTLRV